MTENGVPANDIGRLFAVGDRVRINWWGDRRNSGFRYGTVIGAPKNNCGTMAQTVRWSEPNSYESLMANARFERV